MGVSLHYEKEEIKMEIIGKVSDITIPLEELKEGIKIKIRTTKEDSDEIIDKTELIISEEGKIQNQ